MHFTYIDVAVDADLQQGDILRRTSELEAVLQLFHPYYLKDDYSHFVIMSQSCDLVLRKGECEAPYLALGVVRPLSVALEREAARYRYNSLLRRANAVSTASRKFLESFLRRLLNNNHAEYFYLHEEPLIGLVDRSCAFLRLSVAIRANEHYATIKAARIATLSPTFQPKLGWLIGNLYSRVGTEDWTPNNKTEEQFTSLIADVLDQSLNWLDEAQVRAAKVTAETLETLAPEELRTLVRGGPKSKSKKKEDVINALIDELVDGEYIEQTRVERVKRILHNSPRLKALLG